MGKTITQEWLDLVKANVKNLKQLKAELLGVLNEQPSEHKASKRASKERRV